jgi:aromatase
VTVAGHTDNTIVIAAPLDVVWDRTNDIDSWPTLFSEYAKAEVIEHRGDAVRFRLTMHPDANGVSWSWVSDRTPDPERRVVHSHRVEPGNFTYMMIHWAYREVDGGTEMRWVQDFEMKPTAPITSAAMAERMNANTKVQMARIKEQIEAGVAG